MSFHSILRSRTFKALLAVLLVFGLSVSAYLWHTRPLQIDSFADREAIVSVSLMKRAFYFGAEHEQTIKSIFTEAPSEIQTIVDFLDKYPVNRKLDWKSWLGIDSNSNPVDGGSIVFLDVHLSYRTASDGLDMVTYTVSSQYRMKIDPLGKNESSTPCGVGRFGTGQTQAYYEELLKLFSSKEASPLWSSDS